jgi:phosphate transport system substrate-binding protein
MSLVLTILLLLAGCQEGSDGDRLTGGGSSFVNPVMLRWAGTYYRSTGGKVDYSSTGSGNGVRQMVDGQNDFGCTDAPMNEQQLQKARSQGGEVLHIPLVMGAVVPAYNLPGVTQPLRFTGPVLADIYLGKVQRWNDPALAALNPGVSLPDQEIVVVRRSDGSGTTYIWSDFLAKVSPAWKEKVGVGTDLSWPVGIGAKGNPGVAGQVAQTPGAIGYIELLYALKSPDIQFGAVRNREGEFIRADLASVTAAAAEVPIPDDFRYSLTDPPGRNAYPIAGTVWAVCYVRQPPAKARALYKFFRWVTSADDGQEPARKMGYAPLPPNLARRVHEALEKLQIAD